MEEDQVDISVIEVQPITNREEPEFQQQQQQQEQQLTQQGAKEDEEINEDEDEVFVEGFDIQNDRSKENMM